MAKQNLSQQNGTLGQTIAKYQIQHFGQWVVRGQPEEDFGIDLEMELNSPEVLGHFIKVQIKANQTIYTVNGLVKQSLSKSFLRYVYECRVPIILIVVDLQTERCWAMWLQQYLILGKLTSTIYENKSSKTLTICIPESQTLTHMLQHELPAIANWENRTQQYIALKDLAQLSLKLYDKELAGFLYLQLERFPEYSSVGYLDELIARLSRLGNAAYGTHEGNEVNGLMYKLIREQGQWLRAPQIINITIRNGEYSRTGLIALGIFYDYYAFYAASLSLPDTFRKEKRHLLEVYCLMREKYPGESSPHWLQQKADHSTEEVHADFTGDLSDFYLKWFNRGDSIFFDIASEKI